ncbi:MAG: pirin family protein [bacterium]|nr:pirin family protein [bacterium]
MKSIVHKADTRGTAFFGWLHSRHTFSFGQYYNPERVHFGALRVLNDDIVKGGQGFGTHPHSNMEIISIPLQGDLEHQDSTGTTEVIKTGDVQIMSAGSGLTHSEYNHSKTDDVNFLQLWVLPDEMNIEPRYDQKTFDLDSNKNSWNTVVAPDDENALWINQNSWFTLGQFDGGEIRPYEFHEKENGVYVFVIEGSLKVNGEELTKRDGIGIWDTDKLEFESDENTRLLLVEVPMLQLQ